MTKTPLPKSKSCPRCKKTKGIDQFGTRMMNGVIRPQSYCLDCRNAHGQKMRTLKEKNPKLAKKDLRVTIQNPLSQKKPLTLKFKAKKISKRKGGKK